MKKIMIALIFCFVLPAAYAQMDNPLKQGMPNTVTLSNGDVVYDLNGEWNAFLEIGMYGTNRDILKIEQEGKNFVGTKLIGNEFSSKGTELIKGVLEKDRFKSIFGLGRGVGYADSTGEISENGNKIIIKIPVESEGFTVIVKLTRR